METADEQGFRNDAAMVKLQPLLDDLPAMKRAGGRPRDRDDLEALEAARDGRGPAAL